MNTLCLDSLLFDNVSELVNKLLPGTNRYNDFIDHVIFVNLMPGLLVWAQVYLRYWITMMQMGRRHFR